MKFAIYALLAVVAVREGGCINVMFHGIDLGEPRGRRIAYTLRPYSVDGNNNSSTTADDCAANITTEIITHFLTSGADVPVSALKAGYSGCKITDVIGLRSRYPRENAAKIFDLLREWYPGANIPSDYQFLWTVNQLREINNLYRRNDVKYRFYLYAKSHFQSNFYEAPFWGTFSETLNNVTMDVPVFCLSSEVDPDTDVFASSQLNAAIVIRSDAVQTEIITRTYNGNTWENTDDSYRIRFTRWIVLHEFMHVAGNDNNTHCTTNDAFCVNHVASTSVYLSDRSACDRFFNNEHHGCWMNVANGYTFNRVDLH